MRTGKLNPMTGDLWVPEGEDWNIFEVENFEITYEPMPEDRKV